MRRKRKTGAELVLLATFPKGRSFSIEQAARELAGPHHWPLEYTSTARRLRRAARKGLFRPLCIPGRQRRYVQA
jgi:hypothetical protein